MFRPRVRIMVPTLPFSSGDFTLADSGNLAVTTPECLLGGRSIAVNGHAFTLGPFPHNQSSRVSPAPPCGQRWGFHRGSPMNRYIEP